MAFTPEDGTGLPNANSLCSVEFADAYFEDRKSGLPWLDDAVTNEDKQFALVEATDYIQAVWENKMKGHREFDGQALSFPRTGTGYDEWPDLIQKVTAEYAIRALEAPLMPDLTGQDASGRTLTGEKKKLATLEIEKQYSEYAQLITQKTYPIPDAMIQPLLYNVGLNVKTLVRG